jgi:hypothetical protein
MRWAVLPLQQEKMLQVEERLPYAVPGAYLVRAPSLSLEDLQEALASFGLLFSRRFLPDAIKSDYLCLFDQSILVQKCEIDSESWAAKVKAPPAEAKPETVVVEAVVKPPAKRVRPGKKVRQMMRALVAASAPPVVEPRQIPVGEGLTLKVGKLLLRLRPFRVGKTLDFESTRPGMTTVPHLTIFHPAQYFDHESKSLLQVDKCHTWISEILEAIVKCGILTDAGACKVTLTQPEASRLARINLNSLQCRFRDDVPQEARNAVFAIIRSSHWFGNTDTLVRCWWRQEAKA